MDWSRFWEISRIIENIEWILNGICVAKIFFERGGCNMTVYALVIET